jgi:hypothetical protein
MFPDVTPPHMQIGQVLSMHPKVQVRSQHEYLMSKICVCIVSGPPGNQDQKVLALQLRL